jgi:hypothetical protein
MNWGVKITLVYLAFVAGMLTLVFKARSEKIELVATDYYEQELAYQERIDAMDNAARLSRAVTVQLVSEGLEVQLPDEITAAESGVIRLYRPSDSTLDREFVLAPTNIHTQLIPKALLTAGLYNVKVEWKAGEKIYYTELPIVVK